MPEEVRQGDDTRPEHASVHTEKTDASLAWVLGIIGATVVLGVLMHIVIYFIVFRSMDRELAETRKSRFPLAPEPSRSLPPEPRLEQINRMNDITASDLRVRQKSRLDTLNTYGPTQETGFIHIPVKRAMGLLANKLPARDPNRLVRVVGISRAVLLSAGTAGPVSATGTLLSGGEDLDRQALGWRQNGLVDGGEPNSGRIFRRRKSP